MKRLGLVVPGELDAFQDKEPLLAELYGASTSGRIATGRRDKNKGSAKKATSRQRGIHPRRYSSAELLKRVFLVNVLVCPHCGGRLRILCAIISPDVIVKILDCLGHPSKPPPILPVEPDPDPEIFCN
jgi:hypothetical protein